MSSSSHVIMRISPEENLLGILHTSVFLSGRDVQETHILRTRAGRSACPSTPWNSRLRVGTRSLYGGLTLSVHARGTKVDHFTRHTPSSAQWRPFPAR